MSKDRLLQRCGPLTEDGAVIGAEGVYPGAHLRGSGAAQTVRDGGFATFLMCITCWCDQLSGRCSDGANSVGHDGA